MSSSMKSRNWKNAAAALLIALPLVSSQVISWDEATAKAKSAISGLTLSEKVALVTGDGAPFSKTTKKCIGNTPANSKINFPGWCLHDGPVGVRWATSVSAFPAGINVAATFNKDLMLQHGVFIGEEFRGVGVHVWLGPVMNLARTPEGGRNWEGAGGDQYLSSVSGAQQIKGAQSVGVVATAKHYIGNEQEHGRDTGGSTIDDRTMREVYLAPFAAAVEAGVGAFMCSYNKLNRTDLSCENANSINLVKKDLNFKGTIMSDWWAVKNGIKAANAGMDLMMPGDKFCCDGTAVAGSYWGTNLINAVNQGTVSQSRVDDMVVRTLAAFYKVGQDKGFPAVNMKANVQTAAHAAHIRRVGAESAVLLKNTDEILPVKPTVRKIAIIGTDAGAGRGPNVFEDRGGLSGTLAMGWGSGTCEFPYLVTPEEAIKKRASAIGAQVTTSINDFNLAAAKTAATGADIAFVFAASNSGEAYITVDGNMGDRNNLTLWNGGDNLITAVADANPNTVVVIHSVGQILMPWLSHPNIKAIVFAMLPGQESGNGLADVLFGDVNPSGRLPFTINEKKSDYGANVVYDKNAEVTYSEGIFIDYKWNDLKNIKPLFPFGHGLSYTSFAYSNIKADVTGYTLTSPSVKISVSISNTGSRAGQEAVQLYVGLPGGVSAPIKQLRGFEKPSIPAGQSTTVSFDLGFADFSYWNVVTQKWTVPAGTFRIYVGASAGDIRQETSIILGQAPSPSPSPSPIRTSPVVSRTSPAATSPIIASPTSCAAKNLQCGGKTFAGSKCCQSPFTCTYRSEWYSICV